MMAGQNFGISPILLATGGKSQFPANHVRFYTVQFVSLGWEGREKWQQGQKWAAGASALSLKLMKFAIKKGWTNPMKMDKSMKIVLYIWNSVKW